MDKEEEDEEEETDNWRTGETVLRKYKGFIRGFDKVQVVCSSSWTNEQQG